MQAFTFRLLFQEAMALHEYGLHFYAVCKVGMK